MDDARMPFFDHIAELRQRLMRIVLSVIIISLVLYYFTPEIIAFLLEPIKEFLPNGGKLTVLSALGGFSIRFRVSIFASIVVCSPLIIWQVMAFILPALTKNERRWVVPTLLVMVVLFFFGMIFCYLVIQKAAFGWLTSQTSEFAVLMPNAEDYLRIIMLLEIGFGCAFQLPMMVFYLSILHVVPYKTFRSQWRIIYLALMFFCAVITPDASPITMLLMFGAIISLYELSLLVARMVIVARNGKAALSWNREQYSESVG